MTGTAVRFLIVLVLLASQFSLAQATNAQAGNAAPATSNPLVRRYKEGELLKYHMKATNQGHAGTVRYEADAKGIATKDSSGHFVEQFHWSGLSFNGQMVTLPANATEFRQQLSLDPAVPPTLPDLSRVNPMLVGPCADLLTFYADLWLAMRQGTLVHPGDHTHVKHGLPNSWADGTRTLVGQDSIDFHLTLVEANPRNGSAKVIVRHVPPEQPQIKVPVKWMEAPVADTANNWVEVSRADNGKYLAEIGKETFDVEITVSSANGQILSATMDNPVSVLARECDDASLTTCSDPNRYQVRREIEVRLVP
jgi:hypothetical protein